MTVFLPAETGFWLPDVDLNHLALEPTTGVPVAAFATGVSGKKKPTGEPTSDALSRYTTNAGPPGLGGLLAQE